MKVTTSIEKLSKKLNLALPDGFEQDWEYRVSNPEKLDVFLYSYLNEAEFNEQDLKTLMIIILDSFNDLASKNISFADQYWPSISSILSKNKDWHEDAINYYALLDDLDADLEDCFAITPMLRTLVNT